MAISDDDKNRIRREKTKDAVDLAMQGRWKEAVAVNNALLEIFPSDVEAYNRLGRALMELGQYTKAREAYGRAMELDPYNTIAKKNLARLSYLEEAPPAPKRDRQKFTPHVFIKETGKAAEVTLRQLATMEILARMATGDEVFLEINKASLFVYNERREYLGQVAHKYEPRLIRLIQGGNKYAAVVSSLRENDIKIIIKETYQHPSNAGLTSFLEQGRRSFQSEARKSMLRHEADEREFESTDEDLYEDKDYAPADTGFHEVIAIDDSTPRREDGDWDS